METVHDNLHSERPRLGRSESPGGLLGWCRYVAQRALSYVTNDVVSRIPAFWIRRGWYRHVVGLNIGRGAALYRGCYIAYYGPGRVRAMDNRIGRNTIINRNCTIDLRGRVEIGDNVSISPEVAVLTAQHRYNTPTFELEHRDVVIENNVWIGMRAMILPGSKIGEGAVVAAGAVVTGNVPPLTVVAGVPARSVGKRDKEAARYIFDGSAVLFE